jgi:hypothetical protein
MSAAKRMLEVYHSLENFMVEVWSRLKDFWAYLSANYRPITAWITAFATFVAALSFAGGVVEFLQGQTRSRYDAALQLLANLEQRRPLNSPICRRLTIMLDDPRFKQLLNREQIDLSTDEQKRQAKACFSDQKQEELDTLFTKTGELKPRGAAILAERVNLILETDEDIAQAINASIAHRELLRDEMRCVMELDYRIVQKVTAFRKYHEYPGFDRFISESQNTQSGPEFDNCSKWNGTYLP